MTQEPRQGGFSKGGFCRVQCHAEENKKIPKDIGPSSTCGTSSTTAKRGVHFCKNPLAKFHDTFGREKRRKFHSARLQGSCSDIIGTKIDMQCFSLQVSFPTVHTCNYGKQSTVCKLGALWRQVDLQGFLFNLKVF